MLLSSSNVVPLLKGLFINLFINGILGQTTLCRYPGAPAHSNVVFSDETLGPGTIATYTCERGFELLGPSRRTCESGQWLPEGIPFCVLNVAAGKAPMQVSTESGGIPQKAIDGSTSAFFSAETCTLTKPERNPWWYVNLLEPYMVQLVRLDFGKPCCGANKPATIIVRVGNNRPDLGTNPICNRFTGFLEEGQPLFLPCNPPMPGAFVSVHLETTTSNSVTSYNTSSSTTSASTAQLSICEAFVYTDQALPIERCPQFRDQPPGSTATYNGKCYIFYNRQPLKFRDALSFCRSRGGTLVDESNPALQGFISWELWRRHRSDASGQYWMGAVRAPSATNSWTWLKGEEVTVSFWNLPLGSGECSRYDGTKGWLWSDTDCGMHLNYICQHQPKACGRPEQPPNSTMTAENFNVGTSIEYSCDEGHLLVGPTARTCLDTGFYNEFPPVCKRIQCGYPADIANGEYHLVNDSVGYLSRVIYNCEEGHEMVGRAQLACDIDERWNGPPPRCDAIQCESPAFIDNGHFSSSTNDSDTVIYGTVVTYSCKPGFRVLGPRELTCMPNGQYDAMPPMCQEDLASTPSSPTTLVTKPSRSSPSSSSTIPAVVTSPQTPRYRTRPNRPNNNNNNPTTIRADTEIVRTRRPSSTNNIHRTPTTIPSVTSTNNELTTTPIAIVFRDREQSILPNVVIAGHPTNEDNEIAGSSNVQQGETPNVNVPLSTIDGIEQRREPYGARLNMGAIIALGAFGGFVFLAAIITTIVILVRRNRSAKHYRHRASPDCNTVASFDSSSSSESRGGRHGGLNRYYRQAWENLHEASSNTNNHHKNKQQQQQHGVEGSPGAQHGHGGHSHHDGGHAPLRRKETLDERHREGSEVMVGGDVVNNGGYNKGEKKRHHHHHHHHEVGGAAQNRMMGKEQGGRGGHKRY